jgi:hypothetical protein
VVRGSRRRRSNTGSAHYIHHERHVFGGRVRRNRPARLCSSSDPLVRECISPALHGRGRCRTRLRS